MVICVIYDSCMLFFPFSYDKMLYWKYVLYIASHCRKPPLQQASSGQTDTADLKSNKEKAKKGDSTMENTKRQYNVSIFPCSENGNPPSSTVRMEIAGDFEEFYKEFMHWLDAYNNTYRTNGLSGSRTRRKEETFKVRDGVNDDSPFIAMSGRSSIR